MDPASRVNPTQSPEFDESLEHFIPTKPKGVSDLPAGEGLRGIGTQKLLDGDPILPVFQFMEVFTRDWHGITDASVGPYLSFLSLDLVP